MDDDTTADGSGYGSAGDYSTGADYGSGYDSGSSLDTQYGSVDSYGGSGEYTTDAGTDVTVDDHSGSGYADVYGPGYGDSDTYANYQSASDTQTELYNEATQAYVGGDEETSQNLTYASQEAGQYANDQYSSYMGTGDYAPEQASTDGYTATGTADYGSGYPDSTDAGVGTESVDSGYTGTYDTSAAGAEMQSEQADYYGS